jgi:hypothetical protein
VPRVRVTVDEKKTPMVLRHLALDLVDGFSKTTNVLAGDTGNRDTAILGGVYRVLSPKSVCIYKQEY